MTSQHIKTVYDEENPIPAPCPPLQGHRQVQAIIVGGGLAGLTTALELANAGVETVLLEAKRLGWGASGRNGGFVSGGFAEDLSPILKRVGLQHTRTLYTLAAMGRDYVRDQVEGTPILQGTGGLSLMRHGGSQGFEQSRRMQEQLFGARPELINGDALRALVNSPRYHSGLFKASAFHINPLAYAFHLAALAQEAGAKLHESSPVERLEKRGGLWQAHTPGGTVAAPHLVIATSAYGGPMPLANRAMVKVATYVVATGPVGDKLDQAIPFRGTLSDTRRAGDYFRTIGQGRERRLIWGGRISTRLSPPHDLAVKLSTDMARVFPALAGVPVTSAWSGLMGYPRHKMPLIGEVKPGLWLNTGFGGHGLNTTAMGGALVGAAIAHGDEHWRAFAPYAPVWTGGLAGRIAAQTTYWAMQAKDRWDERDTAHA
ncbi:MAG: FAD-binding oxidoreductase [Pseudomonadota bacterium]